MSAATGLHVNSYSCQWGAYDASEMLRRFWEEHGTAMRDAFGESGFGGM
jgi:hypothetical protein